MKFLPVDRIEALLLLIVGGCLLSLSSSFFFSQNLSCVIFKIYHPDGWWWCSLQNNLTKQEYLLFTKLTFSPYCIIINKAPAVVVTLDLHFLCFLLVLINFPLRQRNIEESFVVVYDCEVRCNCKQLQNAMLSSITILLMTTNPANIY